MAPAQPKQPIRTAAAPNQRRVVPVPGSVAGWVIQIDSVAAPLLVVCCSSQMEMDALTSDSKLQAILPNIQLVTCSLLCHFTHPTRSIILRHDPHPTCLWDAPALPACCMIHML